MLKQNDLIKKGDWNTLVIFDACRYDTFLFLCKDIPGYHGALRAVDTGVIDTPQWYINNWVGTPGEEDVVLISANPQSFRWGKLKFKQSIKAWDALCSASAVLPDLTMGFYLRHGRGGRTVIHFIPPHLPFLSNYGMKLNAKCDINPLIPLSCLLDWQDCCTEWGVKNGWEELHRAYTENLKVIFQKVCGWSFDFDPPIVITSDHGECLGEGNVYGHSYKDPELREIQTTVPWFELNDDVQKTGARLKALGYVE